MATNNDLVHVGTLKKNICVSEENEDDLIFRNGRAYLAVELIDKAFNETPPAGAEKCGEWVPTSFDNVKRCSSCGKIVSKVTGNCGDVFDYYRDVFDYKSCPYCTSRNVTKKES